MFIINFLNDASHPCSSNMCTIPRYKIVKPMVHGNRYMEGICSCLLWNSYRIKVLKAKINNRINYFQKRNSFNSLDSFIHCLLNTKQKLVFHSSLLNYPEIYAGAPA